MNTMATKGTREIDAEIGRRVRAARGAQSVPQTKLAEAVGVTFQQIQKYERGANRVSAGRLFDIAHVLRVPITYFFDGLKPTAPRPKRR
jgi:transcriptional regulator with XRE-family HTH domain